jgi:hypothetical protein
MKYSIHNVCCVTHHIRKRITALMIHQSAIRSLFHNKAALLRFAYFKQTCATSPATHVVVLRRPYQEPDYSIPMSVLHIEAAPTKIFIPDSVHGAAIINYYHGLMRQFNAGTVFKRISNQV